MSWLLPCDADINLSAAPGNPGVPSKEGAPTDEVKVKGGWRPAQRPGKEATEQRPPAALTASDAALSFVRGTLSWARQPLNINLCNW